jgi:uncharacterized integral membrane protein
MARDHPTTDLQPVHSTDLADEVSGGDSAIADERAERQRQRAARRQTEDPAPLARSDHGPGGETRGARLARKAHRTRLHLYTLIAVVVLVYVVALAVSNTAHVKVNWVFGSSSVSLDWLVLFAAILGWLLGVLITAVFRWRTRARHTS